MRESLQGLILALAWKIPGKVGEFDEGIGEWPPVFSEDMSVERKYDMNYWCCVVVNHIGVRAIGGHYIVDVFHPGYNCWVRCDDNNVFSVPTANVTKFISSKVPYLIFYRRLEPS